MQLNQILSSHILNETDLNWASQNKKSVRKEGNLKTIEENILKLWPNFSDIWFQEWNCSLFIFGSLTWSLCVRLKIRLKKYFTEDKTGKIKTNTTSLYIKNSKRFHKILFPNKNLSTFCNTFVLQYIILKLVHNYLKFKLILEMEKKRTKVIVYVWNNWKVTSFIAVIT